MHYADNPQPQFNEWIETLVGTTALNMIDRTRYAR